MPNYISELNLPVLNTSTGQLEHQSFTIKDPNASGGGSSTPHVYTLFRNSNGMTYGDNVYNNGAIFRLDSNNNGLVLTDYNGEFFVFNRKLFNAPIDVSRNYYHANGTKFNGPDGVMWPNFNSEIITVNNETGNKYQGVMSYTNLSLYNQPVNLDLIVGYYVNDSVGSGSIINNCQSFNAPIDIRLNTVNASITYAKTSRNDSKFVFDTIPSFNQPVSFCDRVTIKNAADGFAHIAVGPQLKNAESFSSSIFVDQDYYMYGNFSNFFRLNDIVLSSRLIIEYWNYNYTKPFNIYKNVNFIFNKYDSNMNGVNINYSGSFANAPLAEQHLYLNLNIYTNTVNSDNLYVYGIAPYADNSYGELNIRLRSNVSNISVRSIESCSDVIVNNFHRPTVINCVFNMNNNANIQFNDIYTFGTYGNYVVSIPPISINVNTLDAKAANIRYNNLIKNSMNGQYSPSYGSMTPYDSYIKLTGDVKANDKLYFNYIYNFSNSYQPKPFSGDMYLGVNCQTGTMAYCYCLFGNIPSTTFRDTRKNIHFTKSLESSLVNFYMGTNKGGINGSCISQPLLGYNIVVSPMDDGNGYYNTYYNLYIYNNYIPD